MTVGRSRRTPAKHELMRRIIGKEVGAARHIAAIERCIWIDLTAGDGIPADELPWERDCSPGAKEIADRTPWFRSISTMGCNTGGLMRLNSDERAEWFDRIQEQEGALPRHRDLLLAAIQSDSAKWAYLLCEPVKWRDEMERQARDSFGRFGFGLDMAWFGSQRPAYEALKRRLFLTRTELGAP